MEGEKGRTAQLVRGILLLALVAGIAACGWGIPGSPDKGGLIAAIVVQAVAFFIILLFFLIRLKVGVPEIVLSSATLPVGGDLSVRWRQRFRGRTRVSRAVVELVFTEKATHGSGKSRSTSMHRNAVQAFEQAGRDFEAGDEMLVQGRFRVPDDGMHSFDGGDNKLEWTVETRLEIDGWPDDSKSVVLAVEPRLVR